MPIHMIYINSKINKAYDGSIKSLVYFRLIIKCAILYVCLFVYNFPREYCINFNETKKLQINRQLGDSQTEKQREIVKT